jgi:hypothetical protein
MYWTTTKWETHLNLATFDPKDEWDMENWFEKAAPKVLASQIPVNHLVGVMMTSVKPTIYQLMTDYWDELIECIYLEDIADVFARLLFRGDYVLAKYEKRLMCETTRTAVRTAMMNLERRLTNYRFMCERRRREQSIHNAQKSHLFLSSIPLHVERLVRREIRSTMPEYRQLCELALDFEDCEKHTQHEQPDIEAVFAAKEGKMATPTKPCAGCNSLAHFRKDCPHRKDRCVKCGKIGHISTGCKNSLFADKAGRTRIVVEPKKTGIHAQNILDQTRPAQTKTMFGTVGTTLKEQDDARTKARQRYAEKRAEEGHPVKARRNVPMLHAREVTEDDNEEEDQESIAQDSDDEESNSDEFQCAWLAAPAKEQSRQQSTSLDKSYRKLMVLQGYINGTKAPLTLDTGATMNCISARTADSMQLQKSGMGAITITGIGANLQSALKTIPVKVSVDGTNEVTTDFAIIDGDIPTLIGKGTLGDLKLILNPAQDTVIGPHGTYSCYNAESNPTSSTSVKTLQQSKFSTPEDEVNAEKAKLAANTELTAENIEAIADVLLEFKDVWFNPKAGLCTTVKLAITAHGTPRRHKVRPVPGHLKQELSKQINDLEESGLITKNTNCPWISPVHLVPKPRSDKWRLVIDYRYVNTQIGDDCYPLPRIDEILMGIKDHKWFTLIDLNWGFWNVSLEENSKQYTGFVVPDRGVFVWNVMPFGLKTSPTVFQRAIEIALEPLITCDKVKVYIDDIIISTITADQNIEILREVLTLLQNCGFYVNFKKAAFLKNEALILGHHVAFNTLKPDPAKVQGIVNAAAPTSKKAIKSLCAAASYLRAYIPNFSEILEPLTKLTGKNIKFKWENEQQTAFELLKEAMTSAVYLTMPDFLKQFMIYTDASEVALGAVLVQEGAKPDALNFIAYASKKLTPAQRRWSTSERELYAVIWACEHFDSYIKGGRPIIFTDHSALQYLVTAEAPKLRRWAVRLQEYNPQVIHVSGENNAIADWLSRSTPEEEDIMPEESYVPQVYHLVHDAPTTYKMPSPDEMKKEMEKEAATYPKGTFDWQDGIAYGRLARRMYVPTKFREQVLLWFHASKYGGHQGVTRTSNRMRKFIWWPRMHQAVQEFIQSCPVCNAIKPLRSKGGEKKALDKPQLFQMISVDFVGPRKLHDEEWYFLVIVDHYSRFMVAHASQEATAEGAITTLRDKWVAKFGAPLAVLSDRGAQFTSTKFKDFITKGLKARLYFTSVEYPQGNGINESAHRILETAIRTNASKIARMQDLLNDATLLHNVTPNKSIGDTPSSLMFGIDLHLPGLRDFEPSANEQARLEILRDYRGAKLLLKQLEDLEHGVIKTDKDTGSTFKVGDVVTYRLATSERKKAAHVTGEAKYAASRSFPQRIIKVQRGTVTMEPLWTSGVPRQAPKEEVKLIATFVPDLLREETRKLFPRAPWIPATTVAAKINPGPVVPKPFTEAEVAEAIDLDEDLTLEPTTEVLKQKKRARMFHGQEVEATTRKNSQTREG